VVVHDGTPGSAIDPAQVSLTYDFKLITPLISNLLTLDPGCGCIKLSATASMYVEY
jgi:hypothetical protein